MRPITLCYPVAIFSVWFGEYTEYAIAARAMQGGVYRVDPSSLWGTVEGKLQFTTAKQRKVKKSIEQ